MNKENLLKLATYLLSDNLKAEFDMSQYSDHGRTCGTVGCALGHGPYAGIPKDPKEEWYRYLYNFIDWGNLGAFDYLFDYRWRRTDNTPQGAGKRILHVLRHGLPHDWLDQRRGEAPLTYLNEEL